MAATSHDPLYSLLPTEQITLSGHDGDDAKPYEERDVRAILARLRGASEAAMSSNEGYQGARYSMHIEWSDEDDAYIVTVPELPGCKTHGATRSEAVEQGEEVINVWLEAARA